MAAIGPVTAAMGIPALTLLPFGIADMPTSMPSDDAVLSIVALALGVAILGEDVGPGAIVHLLLILTCSWLSTAGRAAPVEVSAVPHPR